MLSCAALTHKRERRMGQNLGTRARPPITSHVTAASQSQKNNYPPFQLHGWGRACIWSSVPKRKHTCSALLSNPHLSKSLCPLLHSRQNRHAIFHTRFHTGHETKLSREGGSSTVVSPTQPTVSDLVKFLSRTHLSADFFFRSTAPTCSLRAPETLPGPVALLLLAASGCVEENAFFQSRTYLPNIEHATLPTKDSIVYKMPIQNTIDIATGPPPDPGAQARVTP